MVSKPNLFCPALKVHSTEMETVTEDDYLGDTITSDCKCYMGNIRQFYPHPGFHKEH